MKIKETVGIDVSKLVIDVRIYKNGLTDQFNNQHSGFKELVKLISTLSLDKSEILFAFEHTGLYSVKLARFLEANSFQFVMLPGLELKRSLGIVRGKNDKVDAFRIAEYAYEKKEKLTLSKCSCKKVEALKRLQHTRYKLVKQRAGYKTTLKEFKAVLIQKDNLVIFETHQRMIHYLTKQIHNLEAEIKAIIDADESLKKDFELAKSVRSVGPKTALSLLILTEGFTKFDSSRKFASYAGIAPYEHSSGTSIRGKTRVSSLANKDIKTLLHLCALSAIKNNQEMKTYFQKRTKEGKNKMSTINIIRNKLLARIFAAVKRQTPYVEICKFAA